MLDGPTSRQASRRGVLIGGALGVLAGCGHSSTGARAPATSSAPSAASPPTATPASGSSSAPASSTPTLPAIPAWAVSPDDRQPACKQAAVRRVLAGLRSTDRVVQVVDAQYGGLLSASASVLVVTRTWTLRAGRVVAGGATYDVRLRRSGSSWVVDQVLPARPGSAARTLTPLARKVLASDRIDLPPAARADVLSGQVHDSVLGALAGLSASYRIGVSVVRSGHPLDVFGTTRASDHPRGRAFDTWSIDGHAVVDARTPRSLVTEYMHAAAAAGSYNVGGPVLLGAAPQWFSDDTHHDHVHAGFSS